METMNIKTVGEKVWAEVFGVETAAVVEDEKMGTDPVSGVVPWMFFNPEVVDMDEPVNEDVCVMDFSVLK